MLLIAILNTTFVNAGSFKFDAYAQKEIYKPGEDVYVYMDIDEIQAGEEGINVVEMNLEYDKDVFESMEFIKSNEWNYDYNSDESSEKFGKLLYTNISSGVTEAENISTIKFKLKSNLEDMETQIILNQVTSNDGKELMLEGNRIITIKIVNDKPEELPKEPEDEPENKPSEEPKDEPVVEDNIKNIPQTGQTRILYIIFGIIIAICLILLIVIAILKRKKDKEDK